MGTIGSFSELESCDSIDKSLWSSGCWYNLTLVQSLIGCPLVRRRNFGVKKWHVFLVPCVQIELIGLSSWEDDSFAASSLLGILLEERSMIILIVRIWVK